MFSQFFEKLNGFSKDYRNNGTQQNIRDKNEYYAGNNSHHYSPGSLLKVGIFSPEPKNYGPGAFPKNRSEDNGFWHCFPIAHIPHMLTTEKG